MNVLSRRAVRRAGIAAVALAVSAAVAGIASPAYADTTADLAVTFADTTIAADASGKFGSLSVTNVDGGDASGITLVYDIGALDQTKVEFPDANVCDTVGNIVTCGLVGDPVIPKGSDLDVAVPLKKKDGATGDAGKIKVKVSHDGTDPKPDNNEAEAAIAVGGSGVDIFAFAPDVYQVTATGAPTDQPIVVGGTSRVYVLVGNQGDLAAKGVKITIKLPEHVSFTLAEPGDCTHAVGDKTTTCKYEDVLLVPADDDKVEDDDIISEAWFWFPVKVAAGAPAPGGLTGGVATADAIEVLAPESTLATKAAPAAGELPENATEEPPAHEFKDVDANDNTDEFTVFVAKAGGGGTLPITGAKAGLIGGAGAATLVVGALLFLMARRRRVVLTTPTDV